MKLMSDAFEDGDIMPSNFTCDGENTCPPLKIKDIPADCESLALIVDDPDAPAGTWVHWLVWNIPAKVSDIDSKNLPDSAVEGLTSFGKTGYGGPCPPSGVHRYYFKLYALNCPLELNANADKTALLTAMDGHILEEAMLMGRYQRV